jgi:hypothetical protein
MKRAGSHFPLADLVDAFGGFTPSKKKASYWRGTIPWVSPKDMKRWEIEDAADHVSASAVAETSCKLIPAPAVLLVVRGMILAHSVPVAISRVPVAINQDMKALRPRDGVDAEYLALVLAGARETLLTRVDIAGHGTRRLPAEAWASLKVPVPDITEQRRILKRALAAVSRVAELKKLHEARSIAIDELRLSLVLGQSKRSRDWGVVGDYFGRIDDTEAALRGEDYRFAGAKSFGRGLFFSGIRVGGEFNYTRIRRLRTGDFVYPKLMAWEGAFGMVTAQLNDHVVSPEFVVFRPRREGLSVEVLDTYFRSKHCLDDVRGASTGSNRRRRRLHPDAFLQLPVPLPSKSVQEKLEALYALEAKSRQEWMQRDAQLNALRQSVFRAVFRGQL